MARVRPPRSALDVAPGHGRHRAIRGLAAQLSAAVTPQEVLDIVADRVGALLGAHMINISVLNPAGDTLSLVITRQTSKGAQDRFATYPVDAPLPSRDALMSRQPVLI